MCPPIKFRVGNGRLITYGELKNLKLHGDRCIRVVDLVSNDHWTTTYHNVLRKFR